MADKTPRMLEVEREFGGDIRDIVRDFREIDGGNSWATVAGILGVGRRTLQNWREQLGLTLDATEQVHGCLGRPTTSRYMDSRVQALGYDDAQDAVLDLRLVEGLTVRETAERLDCTTRTVRNNTPEHLHGAIRNYSDRWYEWVASKADVVPMDHPWRRGASVPVTGLLR